MSFYNMLFGRNPQATLLLAVIGLRENDVERFRDVSVGDDGKTIDVYTRTGGGNRDSYPNVTMRKLPTWERSVDDDFDSTYCTDTFRVPQEWVEDVQKLGDIFANGLRPEFGQHLAVTLRREPTESDKAAAATEQEREALARTRHFQANGHTFVPMDDAAMETALKLAEENGGELRSCCGIAPIALIVKTDFVQWPNARDEGTRQSLTRAEINYDFGWAMDAQYWAHCQKRFGEKYPLAMAKIAETVAAYEKRAKSEPPSRDRAADLARAAGPELLKAIQPLAHYARCQVESFKSGRPYLDMTAFPRLLKDADAAIAKATGAAS